MLFVITLSATRLILEVCINSSISVGRSYLNVKALNIHDCIFERIEEWNGDGGVVCCNEVNCSLIISMSSFVTCKAKGNGGAVFFYAQTSEEIRLDKICATKCHISGSVKYGQFCYVQSAQYEVIERNYRFLSISYCSNLTSMTTSYPLYLNKGRNKLISSNSSNNRAMDGSGFLFQVNTAFNCQYCTFVNDYSTNSICLYCIGGENDHNINYVNLICNYSPGSGVISAIDNVLIISHCVFVNNSGRLLYCKGGKLYIDDTIIGHQGSMTTTSSKGSISIGQNCSMTHYSTYNQMHYQNAICKADNPYYEIEVTFTITRYQKATFSPVLFWILSL